MLTAPGRPGTEFQTPETRPLAIDGVGSLDPGSPVEPHWKHRLHKLAWICGLGGAFCLSAWQVRHRAPLTWDEAAKLNAGSAFTNALRSGNPASLWHWLNVQTSYSVITPLLHGITLAATGSLMSAAWLPTLLAYLLTGVLAGRLARSLGAARPAAWLAAVASWASPINARLSGGAFSEDFGACVLLALLLAMVQMERKGGRRNAVTVGALISLAALINFDYGIVALGTVILAGVVLLPGVNGKAAHFILAAVVGVVPPVLLLASFYYNAPGRLTDVARSAFPTISGQRIDLFYYLRQLYSSRDIGLSSVVVSALLLAIVWTLWVSHPKAASFQPVFALLSWLLVFTLAAAAQPTYVAIIIPVLSVMAVLVGQDLLSIVHLRPPPRPRRAARATFGIASCVLMIGIGSQIATQLTNASTQLWFLQPRPPVSAALAFAAEYLPRSSRPVLLIGSSNALSGQLLQLVWSRQLGYPAPAVTVVPEAAAAERKAALLDAIRRFAPSRVIAVDMSPSSGFVDMTPAGTEQFPSQHDYATIAAELADSDNALALVASFSLPTEPVSVDVWEVQPTALSGTLRVMTSPAVPGMITVDGVPRDKFGLWTYLPVGFHEVCFGPVFDYRIPGCRAVTLSAGSITTVHARYLPAAGAPGDQADGGGLVVGTTPPVPSQISVDGIPRDTGTDHLTLSAGVHAVCFGYVAGYSEPSCQDVSVPHGGQVSIVGRFTQVPSA